MRIGELQGVSDRIFALCNEMPWGVLAQRTLVVDLGKGTCDGVHKVGRIPGDRAVLICPMGPVVGMLRDDFMRETSSTAGRAQRVGAKGASQRLGAAVNL